MFAVLFRICHFNQRLEEQLHSFEISIFSCCIKLANSFTIHRIQHCFYCFLFSVKVWLTMTTTATLWNSVKISQSIFQRTRVVSRSTLVSHRRKIVRMKQCWNHLWRPHIISLSVERRRNWIEQSVEFRMGPRKRRCHVSTVCCLESKILVWPELFWTNPWSSGYVRFSVLHCW